MSEHDLLQDGVGAQQNQHTQGQHKRQPLPEAQRIALDERLRAFIELLPDTYREAVRLHEVEGLTQREVSDALGLSLSGAKSRIQRGRAELKRLLLDWCHIELDRRGNVVHVEARQRCCAGRTPLASTS